MIVASSAVCIRMNVAAAGSQPAAPESAAGVGAILTKNMSAKEKMGEWARDIGPQEPRKWVLIFNTKAANWWTGFVAFGHYKHVSALGRIPHTDLWILYDAQFGRTQLAVGSLRDLLDIAAPAEQRVDMMWITAKPARRFFPPLFICTTAIAHLLGLQCSALRPDALWRHCLLNGGEVVSNGKYAEAAATSAKSDVRHAGAAECGRSAKRGNNSGAE
jgi:hypothetical protein